MTQGPNVTDPFSKTQVNWKHDHHIWRPGAGSSNGGGNGGSAIDLESCLVARNNDYQEIPAGYRQVSPGDTGTNIVFDIFEGEAKFQSGNSIRPFVIPEEGLYYIAWQLPFTVDWQNNISKSYEDVTLSGIVTNESLNNRAFYGINDSYQRMTGDYYNGVTWNANGFVKGPIPEFGLRIIHYNVGTSTGNGDPVGIEGWAGYLFIQQFA